MPKQKPNQEAIQMELFPSEKSERVINHRDLVINHIKFQDKIQMGLYGLTMKQMKGESCPLSVTEIKQLSDVIRNAGTWAKQSAEVMAIINSEAEKVLMANEWDDTDWDNLSDAELDERLSEWL